MYRVEIWCDGSEDRPCYICESSSGIMWTSVLEDHAMLYSKEQLPDVISTLLSKYDNIASINIDLVSL